MDVPAEIRVLIEGLQRRIEALEGRVAELERENSALRAENADLKRKLGLDSSTSSKPPSSDGLRKKPVSLREPSAKSGGGQEGHKGDTLKRVAEPDRVVTHEAGACRHCGAGLTRAMAHQAERRQVFDLPAKLIEVPEHRGLVYACACCGGRTAAAFPGGVGAPAQYGERLRAAAVYLHVQQLIAEDRAAQTLADLFGADRLCPASVMGWVKRKAKALAPVADRIGALVAGARVRCLDDPSTMLRTAFASRARRNGCIRSQPKASRSIACRPSGATSPKTLPAGWSSTTASNPMAGLPQPIALCNAHHLRELKALIAFDGEPWAERMRDLLGDANRAVDVGRARGDQALEPPVLAAFQTRFWDILREGLAFHRKLPRLPKSARGRDKPRPGENLLRRLHAFKDDVLRFMVDFDVPFTNNLGLNRRGA